SENPISLYPFYNFNPQQQSFCYGDNQPKLFCSIAGRCVSAHTHTRTHTHTHPPTHTHSLCVTGRPMSAHGTGRQTRSTREQQHPITTTNRGPSSLWFKQIHAAK